MNKLNLLEGIRGGFYAVMVSFFYFPLYVTAMDVVVATGENQDPPFVYGDKQLIDDYPGVTIDILRFIESKSDMAFIIEKYPWRRVVHFVKNNQIDGGFHFSYKEKRKSFVAYPIRDGEALPDVKYSISNRSYSLYRLKGQDIHWDGKKIVGDSKNALIIGAIRGGSITEDLKKKGYTLNEVSTDQQLIQLLLSKRIHAFVALDNMLDAKIELLEGSNKTQIEKTFPAVVNKPYYIAFSKKFYRDNPDKAWKVWEMISELKESGGLKEIYSKYVGR
ncbi:MAG: transporter substrate-binding domain-containing protein [Pseudomonadales bacterium]|nr:transporter substrate-binding domain-containing protein [Pseudomonadales bacterium]